MFRLMRDNSLFVLKSSRGLKPGGSKHMREDALKGIAAARKPRRRFVEVAGPPPKKKRDRRTDLLLLRRRDSPDFNQRVFRRASPWRRPPRRPWPGSPHTFHRSSTPGDHRTFCNPSRNRSSRELRKRSRPSPGPPQNHESDSLKASIRPFKTETPKPRAKGPKGLFRKDPA